MFLLTVSDVYYTEKRKENSRNGDVLANDWKKTASQGEDIGLGGKTCNWTGLRKNCVGTERKEFATQAKKASNND